MLDRYVSLCVLSYNRPHLLRTTLETALLGARDERLELIIHDDGSSDNEVFKVLAEYAHVATVITNPQGHNQGQGVALNRMFNAARGDLIIKCDQDLVFNDGWLTDLWRIFDRNDVRYAAGDEPMIGLLGLCHYFHPPVDKNTTIVEQHDGWEEHPLILGSAFAMPRDAWVQHGPFEEHSDAFNEDGAMQRTIDGSMDYACGLPDVELAQNPNMGPGPSTIVYMDENDEVAVSIIHHGPYILQGPARVR